MARSWVRVLPLIVLGGLSACSSSGISIDCVFVSEYQGHTYHPIGVQVAPVEGRSLGTVVVPGCGPGTRDQRFPVAELRGVSPEVAMVLRDVSDQVLVRDGIGELPPEVGELMKAPKCDPGDVPIDLSGPWLGIHDAHRTELDLLPPYDVDLLVERASAERYVRAFLTIHVPRSLGRPISQADLDSSLRQEGTISVTAGCLDDGYVAMRVKPSPG